MTCAIDLPAYLRRIGFEGEARPDAATLRALAAAHVAAIPFENLDPFLGIPIALELPRLERKLVEFGRGGYCFEQNFVFREALRAIGYPVQGLIARVLWQRDEHDITAQSHMRCTTNARGFVTRSEPHLEPTAAVNAQTNYPTLFVSLLDNASKELATKLQADIDASKANLK